MDSASVESQFKNFFLVIFFSAQCFGNYTKMSVKIFKKKDDQLFGETGWLSVNLFFDKRKEKILEAAISNFLNK